MSALPAASPRALPAASSRALPAASSRALPAASSRALPAASSRALGTSATVVADGDAAALALARAAVERELDAIDRAASRFRDDSELTAVNAAGGRPVAVGPLLWQAVQVALRAARGTAGAVDPALGAQLRRAGYDRDFAALEPARGAPADGSGATAVAARAVAVRVRRPSAGWRAVELDPAARTVRVPAGVELDLGATAKALAADRAARAARRAAGCGVLVSLGGDVAVAGPAPADGWAIHVTDDHRAGPEAFGETIAIRSGGLATSGTTVRRWRAHGAEHHHILDPRSGRPAAVVWRTATVAAASCVDANVASTAAIVRGAGAPAWLLALGLPARLVAREGRVLHVGAWPQPPDAADNRPHAWPAGRPAPAPDAAGNRPHARPAGRPAPAEARA
jgi:thiamine biosynthesis lipoprotein